MSSISSFRVASLFLLAALASMAVSPPRLFAAEPVLVADFTPGSGPAELLPEELSAAGGRLFFSGSLVRYGSEPWVGDGNGAGVHLLGDVCPGSCWSSPRNFTALGSHVVFNGQYTEKLYSATGDRVETLADLGDPYPVFTRLGEILFVTHRKNGADRVLRTDGTPEGTRPASDFCSASGCFRPEGMTAIGEALYYWRDGQLWQLVAEGDSRPIAPLAFPAHGFTPLGATKVLFSSCVGSLSFCPAWVTDGTGAGTRPLESAPGITNAAHLFFPWRDRVYFTNEALAIVSTDGAPEGTRLESGFAGNEPRILAATEHFLLYSISSDSTAAAVFTVLAVDAAGHHVEILGGVSQPQPMGRVGSRIVLKYRKDGAYYLAASDGTAGGTVTLTEGSASPTAAVLGGLLYFGLDAGPAGRGLWRTDGSPAGTRELELGLTEPFSSFIEPHRVGGSLLLFGEMGFSRSPWRLDPVSLAAVPAEPRGRSLQVVAENGSILFAEETDSGMRPLLASAPATLIDLPISLFDGGRFGADGLLYFSDAGPGKKIWASDGTAAGTRELIDFSPGWLPCGGSSYVPCLQGSPLDITPSGDRVFFSELEGYLYSAWVWEKGRPAARRLPFRNASPIAPLAGGKALLRSLDPDGFWISDGTDAGTRLLFATPAGSAVGFSRLVGDKLYFQLASDGDNELWASHLESGETVRLSSEVRAFLAPLIPLGDGVIFRASRDARTWNELGISDGTPAGTRFFDLGARFEYPSIDEDPFVVDRQSFVFAAAGDAAGLELWISNGSPEGTYRLTDLAPGAQPSSPTHFALAGRRLFFQADDGVVGRELFALDLPPLPPCTGDQACLMDDRFAVEVTARTAAGTFSGRRVAGSGDSAVFTFFSENNWEMLVKVLDGCAINGRRWVFAAAATDVAFTLRVIDRATGAEKVYANASGKPAVAVTDSSAFACD